MLALRLKRSDEVRIRPDRLVSEDFDGNCTTRTVVLVPSIFHAEDLPVPVEIPSALAYARDFHGIETSIDAWIDFPLSVDVGHLLTRYDGLNRSRVAIMQRNGNSGIKRKLNFD